MFLTRPKNNILKKLGVVKMEYTFNIPWALVLLQEDGAWIE